MVSMSVEMELGVAVDNFDFSAILCMSDKANLADISLPCQYRYFYVVSVHPTSDRDKYHSAPRAVGFSCHPFSSLAVQFHMTYTWKYVMFEGNCIPSIHRNLSSYTTPIFTPFPCACPQYAHTNYVWLA